MNEDCCENCFYVNIYDKGRAYAYCHRYPPTIDNNYPVIKLDDWCGEYKKAPKAIRLTD